ncbi:MAG: hypothetical protein IOB84_13170 [Brevundimonas sp.]|nr:hypothetical protein [Brevundimonas sp.]
MGRRGFAPGVFFMSGPASCVTARLALWRILLLQPLLLTLKLDELLFAPALIVQGAAGAAARVGRTG